MPAYIDFPTTDLDVGSPLSQTLMTGLFENVAAMAERATGAPKILGVPYNTQIFAASGTWTKPANAETGDIVLVWGVAGGGSGGRDTSLDAPTGGGGGYGSIIRIADIDNVEATMAVTIGSGAATNTSGNGSTGGTTRFGSSAQDGAITFPGGTAGRFGDGTPSDMVFVQRIGGVNYSMTVTEGLPGLDDQDDGGRSLNGGGGGAGARSNGGLSSVSGHGGASAGSSNPVGQPGLFPGGGGGAGVNNNGGAGADGYMIVYCVKET